MLLNNNVTSAKPQHYISCPTMLNYCPKKHGQACPARELIVKDKDDEQPPPPQLDHYQHTRFGSKWTSTRSSACTTILLLPSLGLHHPSTAINPPRFVPEPLSSSFLDPDYALSAELLGGDEEHSSTRASRPLGVSRNTVLIVNLIVLIFSARIIHSLCGAVNAQFFLTKCLNSMHLKTTVMM